MKRAFFVVALTMGMALAKTPQKQQVSDIERYIEESNARAAQASVTAGSLYSSEGTLGNLARDLRASQVDDIITVVVADRATAQSRGELKSSRTSKSRFSIGSVLGATRATGPLADMARTSGERQVEGQGETTRENALTTTLSARVTHVLPNGNMVVQGVKQVAVNSEVQTVRVRGVVRPYDLSAGNTVRSDRLASLEVQIDGRGAVGDVIKRPFILYRLLMGILPF